jgi:hypothetical protein
VTGHASTAGGDLVVEGDVLHFRPNPLARRLGEEDWSLPLADVTGFRASPVSVRDAFAGGLRPRLALDVGRGTTHLFIVKDPAAVAKELLALAVDPVGSGTGGGERDGAWG